MRYLIVASLCIVGVVRSAEVQQQQSSGRNHRDIEWNDFMREISESDNPPSVTPSFCSNSSESRTFVLGVLAKNKVSFCPKGCLAKNGRVVSYCLECRAARIKKDQ